MLRIINVRISTLNNRRMDLFYRSFRKLKEPLTPGLLNFFQSPERSRKIHNSFYETNVTLMQKQNMDDMRTCYYWPISLINTDITIYITRKTILKLKGMYQNEYITGKTSLSQQLFQVRKSFNTVTMLQFIGVKQYHVNSCKLRQ